MDCELGDTVSGPGRTDTEIVCPGDMDESSEPPGRLMPPVSLAVGVSATSRPPCSTVVVVTG